MTDVSTAGALPPARITGLDVTRGFAVMGILAMNIVAFAMPQAAYITPLAWGEPTGTDIGAWAVAYVLFDSKMRGLFSMMFGASTLLVINSAVAAGRDPARTHYARMVTLAVFGLLHFYLIWFGDILFIYAMCGMLLYFFRNLPVRKLAVIGGLMIAVNTLGFGGIMTVFRTMALQSPGSDTADGYAVFLESFTPVYPDTVAEFATYTGDYGGIVADRWSDIAEPLTNLLMWGLETLGLMLIGMALYKSGLLRGEWSADRLRRWAVRCLAIGVAGNLALLAWQFASGLDAWVLLTSTMSWSVPFDVVMSVGYAALFMWLAQSFAGSALIARIAATGRAAFSNYLGTSILMTTIFYGYGLGLFGHMPRATLYLFVVAAWVLMLLWSKPWLDRFRYGPLEWLWRSLARGSLQPMRR